MTGGTETLQAETALSDDLFGIGDILRLNGNKQRLSFALCTGNDTVRVFWTLFVGKSKILFYFFTAKFRSTSLGVCIPNR